MLLLLRNEMYEWYLFHFISHINIHITNIIFCTGLENHWVMPQATESRLHALEEHLRVTFQAEMLRVSVFFWLADASWFQKKYGCKIDCKVEIWGSILLHLKKLYTKKSSCNIQSVPLPSYIITTNIYLTYLFDLDSALLERCSECGWGEWNLKALPKNPRGALEAPSARYALHRTGMDRDGVIWWMAQKKLLYCKNILIIL